MTTFAMNYAVEHPRSSDEDVEEVESQWTFITGHDRQPKQVLSVDGYVLFSIIPGAFRGKHYVSAITNLSRLPSPIWYRIT